MYCAKCGNQIKDGAAFCPFCGAGTGAAAQTLPTAAGKAGGFLKELVLMVKEHVRTVIKPNEACAPTEHRGFQWAVVCAVQMLLFSLTFTVNLSGLMPKSSWLDIDLPFGKSFAINLLVAFLFRMLSLGLSVLDLRYIRKSSCGTCTALNALTVVSVPMAAVYLVNLLLGMISFVPALCLFTVGFIAVLIARADAFGKCCGAAHIPLADLFVINGVSLLTAGLVGYALYEETFEEILFYLL
jgi:hypothetical protein